VEEIAMFVIGLVLTGIMFLIKVTLWASLGYFWVFLPLMLFTGVFIFACDCF
jgi:hypothetical protein